MATALPGDTGESTARTAPAASDDEAPAGLTVAATGRHGWVRRYTRRVAATDAVAVAVAIGAAYVIRFPVSGAVHVSGEFSATYLLVSLLLLAAWLLALALGRTRDRRLFGTGSTEYSRVADVTWRLFAGVAIVAYLLKMQIGRGFLGIAFPLGMVLLLIGRYAWRSRLHRRRDRGLDRSPVLVVGPRHKAERLITEFHRNPRAGFVVVGVCVPDGELTQGASVLGVPVLGVMAGAARLAAAIHASAIAIAGSDAATGDVVRQLGWDLEGTGVDLAMTLALADVAGPRVLMQPVNGLPLIYVDEPRFTGGKYVLKSTFDWLGALIITVVLSPLLLAVGIVVKATSPGPVFYLQERIGKDGKAFHIFKFRTMVVGAHGRLAEVLAAQGGGEVGAFYKPTDDPRITRVGKVLRRYSLDELPQLLNVLRGEMSLVGPRPQIAAEVAGYDRAAHRRLLVKPGLTGLWQVSGRSSLDPEAAMRMDVTYVENWTPIGDLLIALRTVKVVAGGDGAR